MELLPGERYWVVVWALTKLSLGSQPSEGMRDFLSPHFLSETSPTPSRKSLQSSQWVPHTSWSQNRKPQEGTRESLITFTASLDNQVSTLPSLCPGSHSEEAYEIMVFFLLYQVWKLRFWEVNSPSQDHSQRGGLVFICMPLFSPIISPEKNHPIGVTSLGGLISPDRPLGKFPALFDLFSRMLWVVWGQHCICNSVTFRAMSKFHLLFKPIIRRREINKGRGDWRGWSVWSSQDFSCFPWRGALVAEVQFLPACIHQRCQTGRSS